MTQEGSHSPALSENLGFLLGQAHEQHRSLAASRLVEVGLAPKEYGALSVLVDEGPLTQQQLGRRTGIDRTTMVAIADALEEKGFAVRERSPADRRAYVLRVTGPGRRTLTRARRAIARTEDDFLEPLSDRQRAQLKSMLRRLVLAGVAIPG